MTEQQKRADTPETEQWQKTKRPARTAGSVIKSVVLWLVCLILVLLGILCFVPPTGIFYILDGIVFLILAVLACPFITSRTKDNPALADFYRIKVFVVIIFVFLAMLFLYIAGIILLD